MHLYHKQFLDIPPEFTAFATAKVALLPFPYEGGISYGAGTGKAPNAVLDASCYVELYDELLDVEPFRVGVSTLAPPPRVEDALEKKKGRPLAHAPSHHTQACTHGGSACLLGRVGDKRADVAPSMVDLKILLVTDEIPRRCCCPGTRLGVDAFAHSTGASLETGQAPWASLPSVKGRHARTTLLKGPRPRDSFLTAPNTIAPITITASRLRARARPHHLLSDTGILPPAVGQTSTRTNTPHRIASHLRSKARATLHP